MIFFLLLSVCTLIAYAGARQYAAKCPKGYLGLPPEHALKHKGRMMLIALPLMLVLHLTLFLTMLKVAYMEEPRILPFAAFLLIPIAFTWMSIDLTRNGAGDKEKKKKED